MKKLAFVSVKVFGLFLFGMVLGFLLTFGVPVQAGDGMVTFTTGQKLPAASLNLIVTAFRNGKFYDSAGAGSNYLGVSHNGTDGVITPNTGKVRISAPTGSTVDLEVNGTDVLAIGFAGITASQYIATSSNIGASGSLEIDGRTQLDGEVSIAGATTATTITASGALGTSSTFHGGSSAYIAGAITAGSTVAATGLVTANAGVKPSSSSDTIDNYDYDTTYSDISLTLGGGTVNGFAISSASYAKIGRLVYFRYLISWTSITTPSGAFTITNCLPVATASSGATPVFAVVANNVDMAATGKFFHVRSAGISSRDCIVSEVYDDGSNVTMTASAFDGNVALIVSGFYVASS